MNSNPSNPKAAKIAQEIAMHKANAAAYAQSGDARLEKTKGRIADLEAQLAKLSKQEGK